MDDIYIKVLQYAKNNPGFTLDDIKSKFPESFDWIDREITFSNLFIYSESKENNGETVFFLSFSDRFKLLEYEELKEARRSSKKATIIAISSIFITFLSIVYSYISPSKVHVINSYDDKAVLTEMKKISMDLNTLKANVITKQKKTNKNVRFVN